MMRALRPIVEPIAILVGWIVAVPLFVWRLLVRDLPAELNRYQRVITNLTDTGPSASKSAGHSRGVRGVLLNIVWGVLTVPLMVVQAIVFLIVGGLQLVVYAPVAVWYWLTDLKWWQLAATGVIVSVAMGVGGFFLYQKFYKKPVLDYWSEYRRLTNQGTIEEILAELDRLEAEYPKDASIAARRDQWLKGRGNENDPETILNLMSRHYQDYRQAVVDKNLDKARVALGKASQEATKLTTTYPTNWPVRLVIAQEMLSRQPPATNLAAQQLAALPRPREFGRGPPSTFWGVLAIELFRAVRETERADHVYEYLAGSHLRAIAGAPPGGVNAMELLMTLRVYQQSLSHVRDRNLLTLSWSSVQKIAQGLSSLPDTPPEQLREIAVLQENNLQVIAQFRKENAQGFETDEALRREQTLLEKHLSEIWDKLLAKNPNDAFAHLGRATQHYRATRLTEALKSVDKGLAVANDDNTRNMLATAKARFLRLAGRNDDERRFLDQSLSNSPGDLRLLALQAEAAVAAGGREVELLEICRKATALEPKLYWARRMEAEVCLRLARPAEAVTAIEALLPEHRLDANCVMLHVRGLVDADRLGQAESLLGQIQKLYEDPQYNNIQGRQVVSNLLLTGARSLQSARRLQEAQVWTERVIARDSENIAATLQLADLIREQIESGPANWDIAKVRRTVDLYERIVERTGQGQNQPNLVAVNNLVWLQLKGLGDRDAAAKAATPLRVLAESRPDTPAEILDTLAAVYIARGNFTEGHRLARLASQSPTPRTSYFINLAEALLGLGRAREASEQLEKARGLKILMNNREAADFEDLERRIKARL